MDAEHEGSVPLCSSPPGRQQEDEPQYSFSKLRTSEDRLKWPSSRAPDISSEESEQLSVSLLSSLTFPPPGHPSRQVRSPWNNPAPVPSLATAVWLPPAAVCLDQASIQSTVLLPSSSTSTSAESPFSLSQCSPLPVPFSQSSPSQTSVPLTPSTCGTTPSIPHFTTRPVSVLITSVPAAHSSSLVSTASPSSLTLPALSHGASPLVYGVAAPDSRSPPPFTLPSTAGSRLYPPTSYIPTNHFVTAASNISSVSTPFVTPVTRTQTPPNIPKLTSVASEPFKLPSQVLTGSTRSSKQPGTYSRNPCLVGYSSASSQPDRKKGAQTSMSPGSSARPRSCDVFIGLFGSDPSVIRFAKWMRAELELQGVACFSADRSSYSDQRSHDIARRIIHSVTFGVVLISSKVFKNPFTIEELTIFLERKNLIPLFFDVAPSDCLVRDIVEKQGKIWEVNGGELWKEYLGPEKEWKEAVEGLLRIEEWRVEAYEGNWRDCIQKVVGLVGSRLGRRSIADREKIRGERAFKEEFPCPRNATFVGREKELKALEMLLLFDGNPGAAGGVVQTFARKSDVHSISREGDAGRDSSRRSSGFTEGELPEVVAAWPDVVGHPGLENKARKSDAEMERDGHRGRDLTRRERGRPLQRERRRDSNVQKGEIDALSGSNQACVTGLPGIGKTELALEFSYRNLQKYRMVLWVGGEARYLRQNYLNLSTLLGIDVGSENQAGPERGRVRSFDEHEAEALQKVRNELQKDIPYLLIIDNLQIERDWWDGREITELLPRSGSATHVLITTRLSRVMHLESLDLSYLSNVEAVALMRGGKGNGRSFSVRELDKFKELEDKLRRLPLGLAIVGKLVSELEMSPTDILARMGKLDSKECTAGEREDALLRSNPFLVNLLDVCFSLLTVSSGPSRLAMRMAWVAGWFGPGRCPIPLLGLAAYQLEKELGGPKMWSKCFASTFRCCVEHQSSQLEVDAGVLLVKYGIARPSLGEDSLQFHDIIQVFCRQRAGHVAAMAFVRAVRKGVNLVNYYDQFWAASFLVCGFANDQAVLELRVGDLLVFTKRVVMPLALRAFDTFSRCMAALELLRLCYVMLEDVEKSFMSQIEGRWDKSLFWRRGSAGAHQIDEYVWQNLTLLKALLLETRAKLMLKGGQFQAGEELCRTCISIRTVMLGPDHPYTVASQETLSKLVRDRNTI